MHARVITWITCLDIYPKKIRHFAKLDVISVCIVPQTRAIILSFLQRMKTTCIQPQGTVAYKLLQFFDWISFI